MKPGDAASLEIYFVTSKGTIATIRCHFDAQGIGRGVLDRGRDGGGG